MEGIKKNTIPIKEQLLIVSVLFIHLLLTFFAEPAPQNIGAFEILILAFSCFYLVSWGFSLKKSEIKPILRKKEYLLFSVPIFIIILSSIIGFTKTGSFVQTIRGTIPFLLFIPLIPYLLSKKEALNARSVLWAFAIVGLFYSFYMLYLFLSIDGNIFDPKIILMHRITQMDPRSTSPLFLCATILFFVLGVISDHKIKKCISYAFFFLGIHASISTLVKAQIISFLFGISVFLIFYYASLIISKNEPRKIIKSIEPIGVLSVFFIIFTFVSPISKAILQAQGVRVNVQVLANKAKVEKLKKSIPTVPKAAISATKVNTHASNPILIGKNNKIATHSIPIPNTSPVKYLPAIDLTKNPEPFDLNKWFYTFFKKHKVLGAVENGRIFDEWLPAINHYMTLSIFEKLLGAGNGTSFRTEKNEKRRYIHNIFIYSLVYFGFFGLLGILFIYGYTFISLLIRFRRTGQHAYLGLVGLLSGLLCYSQFFVCFKSLPYNLILATIFAFALPSYLDFVQIPKKKTS